MSEIAGRVAITVRVAHRFKTAGVDYLREGSWYEMRFSTSSDIIYFKPLAKQKNGGWSGVQVEVDPERPRKAPKAKKSSHRGPFQFWKEVKDVPPAVESAARAYSAGE